MIRFLFVISTGRSGSHYLSEVFKHVAGCASFHEPWPTLNDAPMRAYLRGDPQPLRTLMPGKLAAMERERAGEPVYVETNHAFIKGFGWLLPEFIPESEMGVIVLRRGREALLDSLQRVHCSPFNVWGHRWIITPAADPGLVALPAGFSHPLARFYVYRTLETVLFRPLRVLSRGRYRKPAVVRRYERALLAWYLEQTEALTERYRARFPGVRMVETDLAELNDPAGLARLLEAFGLQALPSLAEQLGQRTNLKLEASRQP